MFWVIGSVVSASSNRDIRFPSTEMPRDVLIRVVQGAAVSWWFTASEYFMGIYERYPTRSALFVILVALLVLFTTFCLERKLSATIVVTVLVLGIAVGIIAFYLRPELFGL